MPIIRFIIVDDPSIMREGLKLLLNLEDGFHVVGESDHRIECLHMLSELNPDILKGSLFNYLEDTQNKTVTRSFLTITVEPSTLEDQSKLMLAPNEPVGVMEGIFFLDDGTPFEVSNMRIHYKYMKYNTFVNLSQE